MTAVVLPMASPNLLKRAFQDGDFHEPPQSGAATEHLEGGDTTVSQLQLGGNPQSHNELLFPSHPVETSKAVNPLIQPSSHNSVLVEGEIPAAATIPSSGANSKRRKLTPAEKEVRQAEKEAKDQQRADEKTRLEESRRVREIEKEEKRKEKEAQIRQKDEERRKKEEERKKKEEEKEEERRKREEEKRKREEEKNKKDKARLMIEYERTN